MFYFWKWSFLLLYFSYILESNFPSLENKKSAPKKVPILHELELFCPKKGLLKISDSNKLNKSPLEKIGCLSNHYTLLVPQASNFLIYFCQLLGTMLLQRSPLSSHFFLTYVIPCHARSHHSHLLYFPPNPYLGKQRISLGLASILTSANIADLLLDSIYTLETTKHYYIKHLSLVLNSLY